MGTRSVAGNAARAKPLASKCSQKMCKPGQVLPKVAPGRQVDDGHLEFFWQATE